MLPMFEGQGRRLKFTVAGGKLLLKWSVRPQVRAFSGTIFHWLGKY